jgi:hypothetical protein
VGKTRFYIIYFWLTFNLLDLITTHVGLQGGNGELNPVYHRLIAQFGLLPALGVKMALAFITIGFIAFLARRWDKAWHCLRTANVALCIGVLWNLAIVLG